MPEPLPLPDGYRVSEAEGTLRLHNPQGALLAEVPQGPDATSTIRARAWLDAWEQIERELKEELRDLREGTRALHELPRVRQYMRMLDAMAREPVEARERAGRRGMIAGLALATAAAAFAIVILAATPIEIARGPEQAPQNIRIAPPATIPSRKVPPSVGDVTLRRRPAASSAASAGVRGRQAVRQATTSPKPARTVGAVGGAAGLSAITGYAVGFGEFASHTSAEIRMRLIRAKGYIVYVTQVGDSFHVVTRPYRARAQAERLANALNEIGLSNRIHASTTPQI